MRVTKTITVLLILLHTLGCEEPIKKTLHPEDLGLLVVEGKVTSQNTNHLVKLSYSYQNQNGTAAPASGATISLTEGANMYTLAESTSTPGDYYTPTLRAITGKTYTLLIKYQGKEYKAEDSPVPVEPLPVIDYYKVDEGYTLNFNSSGSNANYIVHAIAWANTPACTSPRCSGQVIFYDLKTIDVNELYKPKKEIFYFPIKTRIIRTKYSLSPAYKNFLRSMLSETEWRGGVFDVQRDNVSTNLSNGAIGFFATSTLVSDTTLVD